MGPSRARRGSWTWFTASVVLAIATWPVAVGATEPVETLCHCGCDDDADGDGAADGAHRWQRLHGEMLDADPRYWLEVGDRIGGRAAQACRAPERQAGVGFYRSFEPWLRCDVRLWLKVRRGRVVVQGVGPLSTFGWRERSDSDTATWTLLQSELRTGRWQTEGGLIVFSQTDGAEFLVDELRIARLADAPGLTPRADFPDAWRGRPIGPESGKKLINAAASSPTIRVARAYTELVERPPFEGTTLRVDYAFANAFFGRGRIPDDVARAAIADLRATPFQRYTENFIWCNAVPGGSAGSPEYHGDWFDDGWWDAIGHNATLAARIVAEGGLRGILFDTEHYHGRPFDYRSQRQRDEKPYRAFAEQARARGRGFMRAINAVAADLTILFTMTGAFAVDDLWHDPSLKLEDTEHGLMVPFLDGMLEAAAPETRLVDGFERSYDFTRYEQFVWAYDLIRRDTASISALPDRYARRIEAAFGIALPWHSERQVEDAIHYALHTADRYVWVWSPTEYHWLSGSVPRGRVAALLDARSSRDGVGRRSEESVPAFWQPKGPDYHAARLIRGGHEPVPLARFGFVDRDVDPCRGSGTFGAAGSLAFDYGLRSIVLDLGEPRRVDAIQVHGAASRAGNVRLDATNVRLYRSDDNQTYTPASFTYEEPDPLVLELSGIGTTARYFKIHATIADTSGTATEFGAGTDYGGARVFRLVGAGPRGE